MRINEKYNEVSNFKIQSNNIHFTWENENKLPYIRQNLYDLIDVSGQDPSYDSCGYFKKKCVKSSHIIDEIEELKANEEFEKNATYIQIQYQYKENRTVLKRDEYTLIFNTKEPLGEVGLEKVKIIFEEKNNKELNFRIILDALDGHIVNLNVK